MGFTHFRRGGAKNPATVTTFAVAVLQSSLFGQKPRAHFAVQNVHSKRVFCYAKYTACGVKNPGPKTPTGDGLGVFRRFLRAVAWSLRDQAASVLFMGVFGGDSEVRAKNPKKGRRRGSRCFFRSAEKHRGRHRLGSAYSRPFLGF